MNRRKRIAIFVGILAGCIVVFNDCDCYATPKNIVLTGNPQKQMSPACAFDNIMKKFLVVWEHIEGTKWDEYDIFSVLVKSNGAPSIAGPAYPIMLKQSTNTYAPDVASRSAVAEAGSTRFLVVYDGNLECQKGDDCDYRNIYAQRVDDNGAPLGGPIQVARGDADKNLTNAKVAYNDDRDEFLVVWEQDEYENGDKYRKPRLLSTKLYGRRLSANGTYVDKKEFAIESDVCFAYDADVVYGGGKYFVVWAYQSADWAAETYLAGRMIPGDWDPSEKLQAGFVIHKDGGVSPSVAYHEDDNNFLVVWEGFFTEHGSILARIIRPDETFVTTASRILSSSVFSPAVAYNPATRMFVIAYEKWTSKNNMDVWLNMSIHGRDWEINEIQVTQGTNRETNPCIAPGKNYKNLVVWEHDDDHGSWNDELYMNLLP